MDRATRKKTLLGAGVAAALAVGVLALTLPGEAAAPEGATATGTPAAPAGATPEGAPPSRKLHLPDTGEFTPRYYAKWSNGLPADPGFFPIAVWLQDPRRERNGRVNAANYRAAGFTVFAGQWDFPEREDANDRLATIREHGMYLFAAGGTTRQAAQARELPAAKALAGLHLGDEQDMSTDPRHITPEEVDSLAMELHRTDSTRPVYNNWGKAFARYPWVGGHDDAAGLRRYCANVDISSADFYAATDGYEPAGTHTPAHYGKIIDNLRHLCGPAKPAWGFVETGHPFKDNPGTWPPYSTDGTITPETVEYAVWSMLAHGANGIVYFAHDFHPDGFTEDGLFDHPETLAVVTRVNAELKRLAPILNAQRQPAGLTVTDADAVLRANADGHYVVAAENSGQKRSATFRVAAAAGKRVEVVGENRTVPADAEGRWRDDFTPWGHHVYRIAP
ncbi:hypothetical protein [Rhizomonospora bruguierae]|uniref:hypothetical protein n=1 Tax=Rhizomonospora bruguierae TaxID=1581705 RepID=UPI001BCC7821|nr:hypothetical protein [Micromonospora sp. NBRC 107566]